MKREDLDKFKEKLLKEKEGFEETLSLMQENGNGEQDNFSSGELSSYDNHPAELGTEVFLVGLNNALKVNEEFNIKQINIALENIDKGIYGLCEVCGNDIERDRLEALPFARKCMYCQNKYDIDINQTRDDNLSRPVEELVIDAPFGRKYLNKQEDDESEGLEYLNDLMKYGSADSPQDLGGYKDYKDFYTNDTDSQGVVEDIENISNEDYIKQLPD